jgi:type IV pilus assembly protein PilE
MTHEVTASVKGFTLIELMIAIAILAIITVIAIPAYNGYVREAQLATARANADSLRVFLEDWRLENNTYQVGGLADYDPEAAAQLGWSPDGDQDLYTYAIVGANATNYTLNVIYVPSGRWLRCEDRMQDCCDGTGAISACP